MCNEIARQIALGEIREGFDALRIPLRFPEALPNLGPLASIRITDATAIVRAAATTPTLEAELVIRRWSWPGTHGKPVYNYRSDGRELRHGRCLVPVDAFYEFTTAADPKARRKDKWAFTHTQHAWFALGGLWRTSAVGEAFTLLTCPPGPDIAPYHARQMVVIDRCDWRAWLAGEAPSGQFTRPLAAGTLAATRVDHAHNSSDGHTARLDLGAAPGRA